MGPISHFVADNDMYAAHLDAFSGADICFKRVDLIYFPQGPEYDQIKLHSSANGLLSETAVKQT